MRDDAHELLQNALPRVACQMQAFNETVPAAKLGETAHLQPAMETALASAAVELGLAVRLKAEYPFQCGEWESKAGVDVGIRGLLRLAPVFCELKWGDQASVLGECSWDLAKMGLAVAKSACSAAVLVAGAPRRRWDQLGLEGPELFLTGRHELAHVRGSLYLDKYWTREMLPQPRKLPTAFETTLFKPPAMELDDGVWELRCVEVMPVGDLVLVEPFPTA